MLTPIVLLALATAPPLRLSALLEDARQRNPEVRATLARARAAASSVSPAGALDDPLPDLLRAHGHTSLSDPLLRIEPLHPPSIDLSGVQELNYAVYAVFELASRSAASR